MRLPFELFLALRYLRFHRGRTFLSVITLISVAGFTVGTAALVIALSLMAGFLQDVRARIHSGSAHLTVLSTSDELFEGIDKVIATAESVPGVVAASPVVHTPAMLLVDGVDRPRYAELEGIVPAQHAAVILGPDAGLGAFAPLVGGDAADVDPIVLGRELALRLGVIEGDRVRAIVPRVTLSPWGVAPRSRIFEVVGTYTSDHFQEDAQRAYVPIGSARRLMHAGDRASWVELRIADLRRLDETKRALREAFDGKWLVVDLIEQNQDLIRALNSERLVLFLAIGLIVVVAALNIVSTLILMVNDKVKEIGTLTAMGARAGAVAKVFLLQGLVIGLVGSLSGLAIGGVAAWVLDRFRLLPLDPEVYYLTYIPFMVRPLDLLFVGGSTLLVALLATIYPAWRAARTQPAEALRYE